MPTATLAFYRVPTQFITTTSAVTVLGQISVTATDDDTWLDGNRTADPNQVLSSAAGTISDYDFLYNTTLAYTPAGGGATVTVEVKVARVTVNGTLGYYVMPVDGQPLLGLGSGGSVRRSSALTAYSRVEYPQLACFVSGTRIAVPGGSRPVETLAPGDLVLTRDHGPQPVRWAGGTALDAAALVARPQDRPIRIRRGALGGGLPDRDLSVSPQHRLLLCGWKVEVFFGDPEVLAPARHLLGWPGIAPEKGCRAVAYHHIAFDRHEIVFAEGAPTESFLYGTQMAEGLEAELRDSLLAALPALAARAPRPARGFTRRHEVAALGAPA